MRRRPLVLATPAIAQDVAAALSAFYNPALAAKTREPAAIQASDQAFSSGDAATGLDAARKTDGAPAERWKACATCSRPDGI